MKGHLVSPLEIKSISEEHRTITGWATRPTVDRVGDIVESTGAKFKLPIPLLLDHNHSSAVGDVIDATVSKDGIRFTAKIAKISEPGKVQELCDSAWQMVKAGLRRAVSIGFMPTDYEPLPAGGLRFLSWEWYELSLVTVPAHAGASIEQIRAIDKSFRMKAKPARIVRLHEARQVSIGPGATSRPVTDAILHAMDQTRSAPLAKTQATLIGASAKATDLALADLRDRLRVLENRR